MGSGCVVSGESPVLRRQVGRVVPALLPVQRDGTEAAAQVMRCDAEERQLTVVKFTKAGERRGVRVGTALWVARGGLGQAASWAGGPTLHGPPVWRRRQVPSHPQEGLCQVGTTSMVVVERPGMWLLPTKLVRSSGQGAGKPWRPVYPYFPKEAQMVRLLSALLSATTAPGAFGWSRWAPVQLSSWTHVAVVPRGL